ncbi:MAG: hypothetical protein HC890_19850 [Chloroflexaceae bacterium]|nr:hypothetical protein [Chloroflexaceae bacterium]
MLQLLVVLLVLGYGAGAWVFWKGFKRTNFSRSFSNRLTLSLLWPVLLVTNKNYRQNFQKALKG